MNALLDTERRLLAGSYYEASVQRPAPRPPLHGAVRCDVCVVGGGDAGLAAALELAERGYRVHVLEGRQVGWGASGRNGGQVLPGFGMGVEREIERQLGIAGAQAAWDVTVQGIRWLRERIARHAIDCDWHSGTLSLATTPRKADELRRWSDHVGQTYGQSSRWIGPDAISRWVGTTRYKSALFSGDGGHLHPLKYCLGLAVAAEAAGVRIHEHSPVLRLETGSRPRLSTPEGVVRSQFVVLAGNAYFGEFGHERIAALANRVMPVGTYVLATERVPAEMFLLHGHVAACDTNAVPDYFRMTADGRLLFGSGESASARPPRDLPVRLRHQMLKVFPQLAPVRIAYAWGGLVDVTRNRAPDFGRIGGNVYYLQGFSGHGLALAGIAGQLVADAVHGHASRFDVLAGLEHAAFPMGRALRVPAVALGLAVQKLRDLL